MKPARRPGIASLEMVLVFPLLLALVAGVFLIARADAAKTFTATRARAEAWNRRADANPGDPLVLGTDPGRSAVDGSGSAGVKPGPLFPTANFRARSANTATGNTWASPTVRFAPQPPMVPHMEEFNQMAKSIGSLGRGVDPRSLFSALNPGQIASGSGAGDVADRVRDLLAERQRIRDRMNVVNGLIDQLRSLRIPSPADLLRLDRLLDELKDLKDAGAKLDEALRLLQGR
jgi:hypothetical protein